MVFHRKDLCEARVKPKMSSYFQMRCTLRWADPLMHETVSDSRSKYWLIYVFSESPFEMVSGIRSSFQMRCTLRQADPPCKTVSDSRSRIGWSMSSVRAHLKQPAEVGQVFRWGVPQMTWPPIWNCHWQQIKYWLIYVCSESPFKTVIFITALHCVKLYILSFCV